MYSKKRIMGIKGGKSEIEQETRNKGSRGARGQKRR